MYLLVRTYSDRMGVQRMKRPISWGFHAAFLAAACAATTAGAHELGKADISADATGETETYNVNGHTNDKGAFFQSLGTNGRSCATCHIADQAMSISPPQIRERFEHTRGSDPLFNAVDGANCANARTSSEAAHSLLLSHGLIRIALTVPANAQFTVTAVHDPYGCALVADPKTGQLILSTYRRPLPSTNLRFLSTMMWDGRESPATSPLNNGQTIVANLHADLMQQAKDAVSTHAQGTKVPTDAQLNDIIDFEMGLATAQVYDRFAGSLDARGALGGARNLVVEEYYPGINDVLGADPNGIAFDESSMTLFAAWENGGNPYREDNDGRGPFDRREARSDIAAGEVLFNTFPINISAVRGLNDNAALGSPATIKGTCTTCHDAPNVGNHSLPLPLDIGIAHTPNDPNIEKGIAELDEPDLPVFFVKGCPTPFSGGQPASFYTTDLGKGMISGLCSDVNRVKGPILRGLAARAPYFHNGAAATLLQAVNFYNQRFSMSLTEEQKHQLVAFLNSL
jgi:cytochrome c peroxidase